MNLPSPPREGMKGRGDPEASSSTPTLALPHQKGRKCPYNYGPISKSEKTALP